MKYKLHLIKVALFGILILVVLSKCGSTSGVSGDAPEISDEFSVITFQLSSGQWSDVTFTHKTHSESYLNNECLTCHNHTDVRDNTIWNCNGCHSPSDSEGNCADDAEGHACWMVQCKQCHATLSTDPTPSCSDCHSAATSGLFLDSAVEGLVFSTATRKGVTDSSGTFRYQAGETITFSIGDIVIGNGTTKPIMTPIDLVTGAVDETDPTVSNISRFLQTLDENGNHVDGVKIPISVINYVQNRLIPFTATPAVFENNTDLLSLLSDLNNAGVFTANTPRSLVDANAAQTNLRTTLDSLASGCLISGIQSSPLVLTASYLPDTGQTFTYKWYRATDSSGANETVISSATAETYQPTSGDDGYYLTAEVTFSGTSYRCQPAVPDSTANSVTAYGTISVWSEVDKYTIQLQATTDTTIDVESWEAGGGGGGGCGTLDFFGNGNSNDYLVTNIFLFASDGSVIDSREGNWPFYEWRSKWDCRSHKNPILIYSNNTGFPSPAGPPLPAGNYILAVGANLLGQNDAWAGTNTDSANSSWNATYRNYRITFTFN